MSWSYNLDNVGTSDLDTVRFLIGDTSDEDALLHDEEIAYCLSCNSSVYYAAAMACETVAARFSKDVSKTVGPLSINLQERATAYGDLGKRLRTMASRQTAAAPLFFGDSDADKEATNSDTDKIGTAIRIDGMNNPGALSGNDTSVRYF